MNGITRAVMATLVAVTLAFAAADVSGAWGMAATLDDGNVSGGGYGCSFTPDGERLTGNCRAARSPARSRAVRSAGG